MSDISTRADDENVARAAPPAEPFEVADLAVDRRVNSAAQITDGDGLLTRVLEEWSQALASVRERRASFSLPGERWARRTFVNRHLRGQSDTLLQSLNLRLALDPVDSDASARRERVLRFRDALEPPPSRWIIVALTVVIAFLAQLVITVVGNVGFAAFDSDLFSKSAGGDPGSLVELGRKMFTGRAIDRLAILAAPSLAAYLVLRGVARGYSQAHQLVAPSENTAEIGTALGLRRTAEFPLDLGVKALLAIALFSWGAIAFVYQTSVGFDYIGNEMYWQWAIGLFGILRICWISAKWHRTGYSITPVLLAFAFMALVFVSAVVSAIDQRTG